MQPNQPQDQVPQPYPQPEPQQVPPVEQQPPYVPPQADALPQTPAYEQPQPEPQPAAQYQEPVDEEASLVSQLPPQPEEQPIKWQSPEYMEHSRTPLWFVGFWIVVVLLMAVAAFVIKSWSFAILVPVMAAALVIYSHRPPRMLTYVLSSQGLYINDQLHPLGEFKSFGVFQDETTPALMLIPIKRFRPGLTVYFPADIGESIVDLLGSRLTMQDLHLDAFDKIVRKLRM